MARPLPKETKTGVRGCPTHAITYEDVHMLLEDLLGEEEGLMTIGEGASEMGRLVTSRQVLAAHAAYQPTKVVPGFKVTQT